jgi:hypothetical protein
MIRIQQFEKAAEHFRMALRLDSSYAAAQQNLNSALKLCQ